MVRDDVLMQNVAAENNLAETVFFVQNNGSYDIETNTIIDFIFYQSYYPCSDGKVVAFFY
jgi:hypothetical protein